ncbi:MAG: hypothetical protein IJ733_13220 [Lachnospiraceae bacterium]|nr:hypothetical protein [Lachnospiraceae bacterium]
MEEFEIKKMEVEFPTELERRREREQILRKALPERENVFFKLKRIYLGPGLRVIFYHCEGSLAAAFFLYLCTGFLCYMTGGDFEQKAVMSMVVFPLSFFLFSYLSCFMDEQEEIIELKRSLHYSLGYLLCLRMFYAGIVMILGNLFLLVFIQGFHGHAVWCIAAMGVSSMFLFAGISVYLYHKFGSSLSMGIFLGFWLFLSGGLFRVDREMVRTMIYEVPLFVHVVVAAVVILGFIHYIRKVEKRDAYAFAY